MELFGFEISRKRDELRATEVDKKAISFVPPVDDDGTPVIQSQPGGFITVVVLMGHTSTWKVVSRMRQNSFVDTVKSSLVPECDSAIEDIVNECITSDTSDRIVITRPQRC